MNLKSLTFSKPLNIGLALLAVGQLLYFAGFTTLFVGALAYVFAVGLPYPRVFRSLVSRFMVGGLLAFSLIQIMGAVQFFVFPNSGFTVLSLLISVATFGMAWGLRAKAPGDKIPFWDRRDTAAMVAIACFAIPFAILCFWHNDLAHITAFASVQSPDGSSHYIAISEMSTTQHLNYRTVQYYPKGFHLASAFVMHGLHANQADLSWAMNARVYVLTYIAWGSAVAYFVMYLASCLLETLLPRKRRPEILLAVAIGPALALLYLFPYAYEGFINYYYVTAAALCGIVFLYDAHRDRKLADWFICAYLVMVFGISMSWGPLLAPMLLAAPVLYMLNGKANNLSLPTAMSYVRKHRAVTAMFAAQLVPLYLHFKYAKLSSQQGLNATGGITAFHYGIAIAGLGLVAYLLLGKTPAVLKNLASNVLVPFYALVGLFVCVQYAAVGELRYYAIKTDYLLEIIVLAIGVSLFVAAMVNSKLDIIQRWTAVPIVTLMTAILLIGITSNPFVLTRQMFSTFVYRGATASYKPDIQAFTKLGQQGQLDSTNNTVLHYDPASGKLSGNVLITNWTNLMQHTTDSTPEAGLCSGRIFASIAYGVGTQDTLVASVKDCVTQALLRHRPYIIVTDKASVPHLQSLFGTQITYVF